MGSNMAEAHPVGFRWPMKAKEKGATLIHVDPRFTRTSALCDVYVGIRAGSDIAFLGGLVNYVLSHDRWFKEYVLAYTNASAIVEEGFQDTEDLEACSAATTATGRPARTTRARATGATAAPTSKARGGGLERRDADVPDAAAGRRDARAQPGRRAPARHSGTRQEMTTASRGRAGQRPHPAASALRLADPEAPLRPLHAGGGRAGLRLRAGGAGAGGRAAVRQLRARADQRHGLRAGLDPAHDRRADDPHRRHPAAAARQHGPAGRRHHGDARATPASRARPTSPPCTTCCPATCRSRRRRAARDARLLRRARGAAHRLLGQLPQVHRQPAQGLVRRRRHAGERLRLLLAAAHGRRLLAAALLRPDVQGRGEGLFPLRPESRRRRAQRRACTAPACATSTGWWCSTGSRPRAPSSGRTTRAARHPPRSRPRCSSSPPRPRRRRRAASPIPSGCSSGTTRRSIRRATAAPTPGSSTTSASGSSSSTPARPSRRDQPLLNLTWDYDFDEPPRLPDGSLSRIEGEPDLEKVLKEINGYRLDEPTRAPAGRGCVAASPS